MAIIACFFWSIDSLLIYWLTYGYTGISLISTSETPTLSIVFSVPRISFNLSSYALSKSLGKLSLTCFKYSVSALFSKIKSYSFNASENDYKVKILLWKSFPFCKKSLINVVIKYLILWLYASALQHYRLTSLT